MIVRLADMPVRTKFGTFHEILYYDGQQQLVALVMGQVAQGQHILCRVHSHCFLAHVFNSVECDCREQMESAQRLIAQQGAGIIIWLDQDGRGHGHLAMMRSHALQAQGLSQTEAYVALGYAADARQYGRAAEVLRDLAVQSVVLLTNSPHKLESLTAAGLTVTGTLPLHLDPGDNDQLRRTYEDKIQHGHHIRLEAEGA